MASFFRIIVLVWADILTAYALFVMMPYLTTVWNLNITRAAATVNVVSGVVTIMPIGMAFLVDAFMGDFWMLLLSSLAYSFGVSCLAMSTPPVLSNAVGNCGEYKPHCIGDAQKVLFYTALALITIGISGHITSLESFLNQQQEDNSRELRPWQAAGRFGVIPLSIVGFIALPYIKPWSVLFGIPAICTVVATFLFTTGSCLSSYSHSEPQGSPLTTLCRVFVASASKMCLRLPLPLPTNDNQVPHKMCLCFPSNDNQVPHKMSRHLPSNDNLVPHKMCRHLPLNDNQVPHKMRCHLPSNDNLVLQTWGLRCLEKAAIVVQTQNEGQIEQSRWKLCTMAEVEDTKMVIRMIPMWMTFIMCGVVISLGNTYFLEQATDMNRNIGKLKVPLPILRFFYELVKNHFKDDHFKALYDKVTKKVIPGKYVSRFGIIVAMLFSVLCCITAAEVETRRLDMIRSHGLRDKPNDSNEKIPMSMFWLLPQFLLLGAVDGMSNFSIDQFFTNQAPATMSRYLKLFSHGVIGAGTVGSVLLVYVVGKVSERGGRPSWFQGTLNKSRLDSYYWTLTVMSTINLILYILVALQYTFKDPPNEDGNKATKNGGFT